MTKIYVVTKGSYSDYSIVGVFSENKHIVAQKLADNIRGEVEDYELDPEVIFPKLQRWEVVMLPDGSESLVTACDEAINIDDLSKLLPTEWMIDTYGLFRLMVICWAKDKTHAIKIANEYRTHLLTFGIFDIARHGTISKNYIDKSDILPFMNEKLTTIDVELPS